MLMFIFAIMMAAVFGRLFIFAVRAAWGIGKVLVTLVLLPLMLIGLVIKGLFIVAIPVLAIIGLGTLLRLG